MKLPEYNRQVNEPGIIGYRQKIRDVSGRLNQITAINAEADNRIAEAGGKLANVIYGIAIENEKKAVSAGVNKYLEQSNDYLYNPETGFKRQTGEGVKGLQGRVQTQLKNFSDDITRDYTQKQRQMFEDAVRNYNLSVNKQVSEYEFGQMSAFYKETGIKNINNAAVAWAENPDLSYEAQEDMFDNSAILVYGDQGAEQNIKNSAVIRSDTVAQTAMIIAQTDPRQAITFFEKNKKLLDKAQQFTLKTQLDKAMKPVLGQEMSEKYYADGLELEDALADVEDKYIGNDRDYFKSCVVSLYKEKYSFERKNESEEMVRIEGLIRAGVPVAKVTDAINSYKWTSDEYKWQMEDMRDKAYQIGAFADHAISGGGSAASGRVRTDVNLLQALDLAVRDGTFKEKFPTLEAFQDATKGRLSVTDYKKFEKYYPTPGSLMKGFNDASLSADAALLQLAKDEDIPYKDMGKLKDWFNVEIEDFITENKRQPTNDEIMQFARHAVEKVYVGGRNNGKWSLRNDLHYAPRYKVPHGAQLVTNYKRGSKYQYITAPDPLTGTWIEYEPESFEDDEEE